MGGRRVTSEWDQGVTREVGGITGENSVIEAKEVD